jgi:molecular chaperone DnaJ
MNVSEACGILGVPVGSSLESIKVAFKQMAVKYHPDRNKEDGAEDKFKEINSAFQLLEKHGTNPPRFDDIKSPFYSTSDHLAEELQRQMDQMFKNNFEVRYSGPPIAVNVGIPFDEAVLGCRREVKYNRTVKCLVCKEGKIKAPCGRCNGTGKRKYGSGSFSAGDRELPCNGCVGTGFVVSGSCRECGGSFKRRIEDTIYISVPPGIESGTMLTQKGKGNYRAKDIYDDLIVMITVLPSTNGLTMSGNDVISTVELSLLEALRGTKKSLRTVKGEKVLEFKPKIKNGDRIRVSGFGAPPNGAHIFMLNVMYPEDVSELIAVLEKNEPPPPEPDQYGLPSV